MVGSESEYANRTNVRTSSNLAQTFYTKDGVTNPHLDDDNYSAFTAEQRRIQSSSGFRNNMKAFGAKNAGGAVLQSTQQNHSELKHHHGDRGSSCFSQKKRKNTAVVLRRSDNEYFSSLQTAASQLKF